jgi:hypothetical protein
VQCMHRNAHTSIQVQSEHSGIPCAMALRLMPCSPWRRIPLASIAAGLMAQSIRLDRIRHRQLDTSHGCQNHTVLPYASVVRPARREPLTSCPALQPPSAPTPRVHRIPPRVRDDRDTPLLSRRDSAEIATDLGREGSRLFLPRRLDDPNHIESARQIRFFAQRLFRRGARAGERTAGRYVARGLGLMRCPRLDDMID